MKLRSDSPFAKLSEEERELILEMAEGSKLSDLAEEIEANFGVEGGVTVPALKRFLKRLRTEKANEEAEEAAEAMEAMARRGKDSHAREAALEAARQKMCELAIDCKDREQLGAMLKALSEEKAREHELTMRERQIAVAEEQAKLGWRKLEVELARAQLKALPVVLKILEDATFDDSRKVAEIRRQLMDARPTAAVIEIGEAGEKAEPAKLAVAT